MHRANRISLFLCGLMAAVLVCNAPVMAAKTCYDCHKKAKEQFTSRKNIHDPVKSEKCESCHGRHGFSQQLVLIADGNELCYSCHKDLKEKFTAGNQHYPLEKGACWNCHDPHASDKKSLLRTGPEGADDPATCLGCHDEQLKPELAKTHAHKPFADLNCLSCHEAHNSPHAALLKQDGSALCLTCHQKDSKKIAASHQGKHTEGLECTTCHSGHASTGKGLISEKAHPPFAGGDCESCHSMPDSTGKVVFAEGTTKNSVCAACHEEQTKSESRTTPHPAVTADNCSDCHLPHSSRNDKLLSNYEGKLCQECHADVLTATDKGKHEPVLEGRCGSCHEVHGSDKPHMLKKEGSALCLECHTAFAQSKDSAVSVHAATDDCLSCHNPHEGLTQNMLKKPVDSLCSDCHTPDNLALTAKSAHSPYFSGNCAGCHSPHFSNQKHLLRKSGPELCTPCHLEIETKLKLSSQHPPATEDCLNCHKPHYSAQNSLLNDQPKTLCLSCHDKADLGLEKAHVHSAAKDGLCVGCHNPHGSDRPKLISARAVLRVVGGQNIMVAPRLTDQRASLCVTCHENFAETMLKVDAHKPVREGKCEACHDNHGSDQDGFVKLPAPALCQQCHTVDSTLSAKHDGYNLAAADCLGCHNPHESSSPKLVRSKSHPPFAEKSCDNCHEKGEDGSVKLAGEVNEVCSSCHDNITTEMKLPHLHAPFEGGECVSCHRVHAADQPKLLKAEASNLCLGCHEDLRGMDTLKVVHKPFGEKKCLDCHKPHGSQYEKLTTKPAESFCLSCHTKLQKQLGSGTVHTPVKSGKCVSCHQPHAGNIKALLVTDKKSLCGKCHNLTSATMTTAHKGFDISAADCQNCHAPHVGQKGNKGLLLPKSHKPFMQGECAKCHVGTSTTQFVASGKDLCATCHDKGSKIFSKPVVHSAIEKFGCVGCHGPHVGFGKGLQKKEGVDQCLSCHNGPGFTGAVQHPPAFEDCSNCHDPHSSNFKNLLSTANIIELCTACHEDAQKRHFHPMGPGTIDPRTKTDLVCTGCHSPHSGSDKNILNADQNRQLCNQCHSPEHQ